jgi:hypothetical protein
MIPAIPKHSRPASSELFIAERNISAVIRGPSKALTAPTKEEDTTGSDAGEDTEYYRLVGLTIKKDCLKGGEGHPIYSQSIHP